MYIKKILVIIIVYNKKKRLIWFKYGDDKDIFIGVEKFIFFIIFIILYKLWF